MALRGRCGIYKITNMNNGHTYVGQSQDIYNRKREHFIALAHHKHHNVKMQTEWDECGGKGFRWDPVEFCEPERLNEREKFWIEELHCEYNGPWVPYNNKRKGVKGRQDRVGYKRTIKSKNDAS